MHTYLVHVRVHTTIIICQNIEIRQLRLGTNRIRIWLNQTISVVVKSSQGTWEMSRMYSLGWVSEQLPRRNFKSLYVLFQFCVWTGGPAGLITSHVDIRNAPTFWLKPVPNRAKNGTFVVFWLGHPGYWCEPRQNVLGLHISQAQNFGPLHRRLKSRPLKVGILPPPPLKNKPSPKNIRFFFECRI